MLVLGNHCMYFGLNFVFLLAAYLDLWSAITQKLTIGSSSHHLRLHVPQRRPAPWAVESLLSVVLARTIMFQQQSMFLTL